MKPDTGGCFRLDLPLSGTGAACFDRQQQTGGNGGKGDAT